MDADRSDNFQFPLMERPRLGMPTAFRESHQEDLLLQKDLSLANRLISALPAYERAMFIEHSELVELKPQTVLTEAGQLPEHAYFPVEGFVSIILPVEQAHAPGLGIALVGNEGMCHTSLTLGVEISSFTSLVQGAGRAFKIHRNALRLRRAEDACLRTVLHRYVDVFASLMAQQAACLHYHTVPQRLARWLLMTRDRGHSRELFLTHETLGLMVGVRRESVSQAAGMFQHNGLISYSRGYLMLLDEARLEAQACPCYRADLMAYDRKLTQPLKALEDNFPGGPPRAGAALF